MSTKEVVQLLVTEHTGKVLDEVDRVLGATRLGTSQMLALGQAVESAVRAVAQRAYEIGFRDGLSKIPTGAAGEAASPPVPVASSATTLSGGRGVADAPAASLAGPPELVPRSAPGVAFELLGRASTAADPGDMGVDDDGWDDEEGEDEEDDDDDGEDGEVPATPRPEHAALAEVFVRLRQGVAASDVAAHLKLSKGLTRSILSELKGERRVFMSGRNRGARYWGSPEEARAFEATAPKSDGAQADEATVARVAGYLSQQPGGAQRGPTATALGLAPEVVSSAVRWLVRHGRAHIKGRARAAIYFAGPSSKSALILAHPRSTPAKEVVAAGAAAGVDFDERYVHTVRSASRKKRRARG